MAYPSIGSAERQCPRWLRRERYGGPRIAMSPSCSKEKQQGGDETAQGSHSLDSDFIYSGSSYCN